MVINAQKPSIGESVASGCIATLEGGGGTDPSAEAASQVRKRVVTRRAEGVLAAKRMIVERAWEIFQRESLAALTARRITNDLRINRHSVHYLFGSMDHLLAAVVRLDGDKAMERLERRLIAENPLRLAWEHQSAAAIRSNEIMALAGRSEIVRDEIRITEEGLRNLLNEAIASYLDRSGCASRPPASVVGFALRAMSKALADARALGVDEDDLSETRHAIEDWLVSLEVRSG